MKRRCCTAALLGLVVAPAIARDPRTEGPGKGSRRGGREPTPARAARSRESAAGPRYEGHAAAMQFADDLATRRAWDVDWVRRQIGNARLVPAVQRLIMPPPAGTAKNWAAYRARFIEPARIQAGKSFWDAHARWLDRAEAEYGVPAEIIVGIIGVETFYGRIMGRFRVLDALATLSFDFPSGRSDRSGFFQEELEHLLELAQRDHVSTEHIEGSFAGALGLAQFMPGSVIRFGVDFDGDGRTDLVGSAADAIGSVARYLAAHGWQRGMATHHDVLPPADAAARATLLAPDIIPSFSAQQMQALGAQLGADGLAHGGPLALVELQNGDGPASHVAGTQNFYVVTRYNWSSYYAMAVIELASAVALARRATTSQRPKAITGS